MSSPEQTCLTHLLKLAAKSIFRALKSLSNASPSNNETRLTVQIPLELQSQILSRLPAKQAIRYQCVCKTWRDEINSTYFTNSHTLNNSDKANSNTNQYVLLYSQYDVRLKRPRRDCFVLDFSSPKAPVKKSIPLPRVPKGLYLVVGSCNGLACFRDLEIIRFSICNVATGSFIITPSLSLEYTPKHGFVSGFGCDSSTNDYKILCVIPYGNGLSSESCVYSLKTNSWKSVQTIDDDDEEFRLLSFANDSRCMVFSNNALHWINLWGMSITCFDLKTERYHEIVLPPNSDRWLFRTELVNLRGCLHLVRFQWPDEQRDCYAMEIWLMTKYRVHWTKLISINVSLKRFQLSPSFYKYIPPLHYAYSKDGKTILIGLGNPIKIFISCELHNARLKEIKVADMADDKFIAVPFNYFSMFSPNPSK